MAKILEIHPENPNPRSIQEVVKTLKGGGLIIFPSDTVYALGCDITNLKAMQQLARLKDVKLEKAQFSIICNDLSHLATYTKPIANTTFRFLRQHLPGPFTFILEAGKSLPAAYKGHKEIGIRVPDHAVPTAIVSALGNPIATTSLRDADDDIREYYTDPYMIEQEYEHEVDLIIDGGAGGLQPSTIIRFEDEEPIIIRQGKGQIAE